MATNAVPIEELDEGFLRCPTCREQYSNPKTLSCQHIFCTGCLQKWVSKKSGKLHCPICRTEQKLSSEGVDGLPDSLLTKNLMELVSIHQQEHSAHCQVDDVNGLSMPASPPSTFCVHHAGAELDVFCETCNVPACQQCCKGAEHREHNILNLGEACSEKRRRLTVVRDKLDARVWRAQRKVSCVKTLEEQLEIDKDIADSQIRGHCDMAIELIQKFEMKLLNELDDNYDTQQAIYQHEKTVAHLQQLMSWSEFVDATLHCTNDLDFLRKEKLVRENFQRLDMKKSGNGTSMSEMATTLKFHSNDDFLNRFSTAEIGSIRVEKTETTRKAHKLLADVGRQSTITPKFRVAFTIDKFWCSYNWTTRTLEYPHALAVSAKGTMFVVDSTEQVHVFNAKGEFMRHFRPSFTSNKPWPVNTFDITVVNEEEIALTDLTSKRVFICSMEGRIKRRCGGVPLRNPAGIAAGKDGRIYVVDNKACRVVVFGLSGKCLHYIGHHDEGPGRLKDPQYVTVNSWNHVIVTDQDEASKHRICVFDNNGEFIFDFGPSSMEDGHILAPRAITCDPSNNVFVSSHRRVVILGPDGTFMGRVDGGDCDHIQDPRGIDTVMIDGQLRVVVTDSDAGCVKVLQQTNQQ
ncbi:uncharacterized protein LOC144441952 [Glandiceps talaboti]